MMGHMIIEQHKRLDVLPKIEIISEVDHFDHPENQVRIFGTVTASMSHIRTKITGHKWPDLLVEFDDIVLWDTK